MRDMTIEEFFAIHHPCREGREWAMANCKTMQGIWDTAKPEWLMWVATRPGVLDHKTLRLFACWCVRQVWNLVTDERSRHAVEVAERFANGEATEEELAAAYAAASASADAAYAAARAAADAARAAADDAARAAADDAAADATYAAAAYAAADAADDSAADAADAAADAAACAAQSGWLRSMKPNFTNQ